MEHDWLSEAAWNGLLHLYEGGLTFDLDVLELWVDTQGQVAGQGPRGGGPGYQTHTLVLLQGEVDDHRRVLYILREDQA